MAEWLNYSAYGLLLAGGFLVLTGSVGLLRLPEAITRIHAAGVADVFGAILMLLGIAALSSSWIAVAKLLLLCILLGITSPAACHALVQAALEIPEIRKRWNTLYTKKKNGTHSTD